MDQQRSRMELKKNVSELKHNMTRIETELFDVKKIIERVDHEITNILSQVQNSETELIRLKEAYEQQKNEIRNLVKEHQNNEKSFASKESNLVTLRNDLKQSEHRLDELESELGTELLSQLESQVYFILYHSKWQTFVLHFLVLPIIWRR